ncbi:hypothetical protein [Thermofilum pendens]|uniref:Transcriptional regulator HTH-type FeoC domain-containing protein n=1 Tax=Thermofilum pendens (strain DSM 2475 / Hrk 5) TaxID=368408 RepID=A1S0D2_THEPD|nr:hypothetical protein [Thermofilum pendens]ABL78912.1 hypothetical protein Tpen_1515 [Thermofilum pendens Hrk 5]
MDRADFARDAARVLEVARRIGVVDVGRLSAETGIPEGRVKLILLMLRDAGILSEEGLACSESACASCPLRAVCTARGGAKIYVRLRKEP